MKRKLIYGLSIIFCFGLITFSTRGQGTFVNLDFEAAKVAANNFFPGWTVNASGVYINMPVGGVSLGGAGVCLAGPNGGAIQGNYSAMLIGQFVPPSIGNNATIAQTGQIPQNAQTLIFWSSPGNSLQAAFDGQMLPLLQLGSGKNYVVEAASISSYAGQTGQLSFIAPPLRYENQNLLDNIQFSTIPLAVPEPGTWSLFFSGAVFFGLARWRLFQCHKR